MLGRAKRNSVYPDKRVVNLAQPVQPVNVIDTPESVHSLHHSKTYDRGSDTFQSIHDLHHPYNVDHTVDQRGTTLG